VSSPLPVPTLAALAAVVLGAFAIETALGFGASVVTVALGSFFVPIEVMLPAFVPVNVVLSAYVTARYRRDIDRRLLFTRIAPLMGIGLPLGMLASRILGGARLRLAFGVFVALLSIFELARLRRGAAEPSRAPGKIAGGVLLVAAGVVHGAFATGGPLAVYVTGRELADKARFRATLSALWLVLNVALLASFAADHRVGAASLATSVAFALPLAAGMLLGEWAHRRVPLVTFRALVFVLHLAAGLLLAARALPEAAAAAIRGAPVGDAIARVHRLVEVEREGGVEIGDALGAHVDGLAALGQEVEAEGEEALDHDDVSLPHREPDVLVERGLHRQRRTLGEHEAHAPEIEHHHALEARHALRAQDGAGHLERLVARRIELAAHAHGDALADRRLP
jgi:hypothetical protein